MVCFYGHFMYCRSIPLIIVKTLLEISTEYLLISNLINHQKKKNYQLPANQIISRMWQV